MLIGLYNGMDIRVKGRGLILGSVDALEAKRLAPADRGLSQVDGERGGGRPAG